MKKIMNYAIACLFALTLGVASVSAQSSVTSQIEPQVSAKGPGKPVSTVVHDSSLTGDGTLESPLGLSVPLSLIKAVPSGSAVMTVQNTGAGHGLVGAATSGNGLYGFAGSGNGVFGFAGSGFAGNFFGDVKVTGTLSKAGGSFKIDHPLDPENKYLSHSFVESPEMMNIYNGNVTTDAKGEATVELPNYFEALNRDFRYQLTVIGQFAQAVVGSEISGNRFTIRTTQPAVKVSWQVTGVRQDAWANQNRIPVEEQKPVEERGSFLHPKAFGRPEELSVEFVRDAEVLKQMRELKQKNNEQN